MKKYIFDNALPLTLVLFACLSELCYVDILSNKEWYNIEGVSYNLGDFLYSFLNQIGYISLIPVIALYRIEKDNDRKGLYLGLIVWNCYEVIQEFNALFKLDIKFLSKINNMGNTWLQILFILLVVFLTYQAHKKWRYVSQ